MEFSHCGLILLAALKAKCYEDHSTCGDKTSLPPPSSRQSLSQVERQFTFIPGYANAALCGMFSVPISPPSLFVNLLINGSQFSNIVARTNFNSFEK